MISNIQLGSHVSHDAANGPNTRTLQPCTTGGAILGITVSVNFCISQKSEVMRFRDTKFEKVI